eukprot:TRINITY_DN54254_c0_g1_i1.p1 TRINITY_DN54254_c0_g1~~TRINITY_DN54254_c0_g1_i1.p1  ORF type:complete len:319 (-),score=41.42 TRINITY_DN54254_c0_g1_i1:44-1000(-)
MPIIGCLRSTFEVCTDPIGELCSSAFGCSLFDDSEDLHDVRPFSCKEELLTALGTVARLVYGTGFVDQDTWGLYDPPLDGEGWHVVEQICETMNSPEKIQAACYVREGFPCALIAYRGTVSFKGFMQDMKLGLPGARLTMRNALRQATSFCYLCISRLPLGTKIYVTGHSLGGYFAEAVASFVGLEGAVFNSPGPWSMLPLRNNTGSFRPNFEVHLTRDDPLAFSLFPKPESSAHIVGRVFWHPGNNHRLCLPFMREVIHMQGVCSNRIQMHPHMMVNQNQMLQEHYPPPGEIDEVFGYYRARLAAAAPHSDSEDYIC